MYETDKGKAWKAIAGAMGRLEMEAQIPTAASVVDGMYADGFAVELIGVDFRKDRDPELKLYFQPVVSTPAAPASDGTE